ncbi:MAG: peptide-methionine (S)-S-oxide reductase MsrA [Cyclobacteriaceae bacterium]
MKSLLFIAGILLFSCQSQGSKPEATAVTVVDYQNLETATFAGGCFWCVEASFEQIKGVASAVSGYSGGKKSTADYRLVSSGRTKHFEAVQVFYDPEVIDYSTLLEIFFTTHDPTQTNGQGNDIGPQYRSAIFYHNDEQKKLAEEKIKELTPDFSRPIDTQLIVFDTFYDAEEYHQDYEVKNPNNPYILAVSKPKIDKVAKKFKSILKEQEN